MRCEQREAVKRFRMLPAELSPVISRRFAMHKPLSGLWFLPLARWLPLIVLCAWSGGAEAGDCAVGPLHAAAANAASLTAMPLNVFGRPETGWAFYEPLIAKEIDTDCAADTAGFGRALARWQSAHGQPASGILNIATLQRLKQIWQEQRPFVLESRHHCPDAPAEQSLQRALPSESYGGKAILLSADALAGYRAMVVAARQEGFIPPRSQLYSIFSAYRSPTYDAARCEAQHNCQGVVRASCSPHRTGYAMDIYLGAAPGFSPDSSADANRLYISRSAGYRWLVRNAARFGLVNYAFEPWHWEFVGRGASR